ncbi:carbohydrate porin [Acidomonas methanolica]|uniref:carbohydrate porin n=1 Tax=Acidomonas methanolica TaxID=437 RepID=UPI0010E1D2B3|nr:carbohydrate porin [Acidomonas methanolica]TCS31242.1 OprB family porin [Acidomonas methanolica]
MNDSSSCPGSRGWRRVHGLSASIVVPGLMLLALCGGARASTVLPGQPLSIASASGQSGAPGQQKASKSILSEGAIGEEVEPYPGQVPLIPGFLQSPYGPPSFGPPYGTTHLLGDWGGVQPWLQKHGVYVALADYESISGNPIGGKRQTYTDAGQVGATVDVNWGKIFHGDWAHEFWLHTLVVNGHGRNLSRAFGDNGNQVQQIYGARGNVVAHLVWAYFEKAWWRRRVDWSVGFIPTGTFFNNSPWVCNFMNVWLCGNVTPTKYLNGGRDWPSGNIGTVLRVMPTPHLYVMGGLFAVSPHAYNGGISGWAWGQDGLGKLATEVEIGWIPEFGRDKLIGHYKVGALYDNSRYKNLYEDAYGTSAIAAGLPNRTESGQSSFWAIADQMLVRNGDGPMNGLIVGGYWSYADGKTSQIKNHLVGVVMDTGKMWGRPLDMVGFMVQWAQFSRSAILAQEAAAERGLPLPGANFGMPYGIQGHETTYEAFYNAHVLNGLNLQPDFQYVNHIGGTTVFKDAAVFSLALNVLF